MTASQSHDDGLARLRNAALALKRWRPPTLTRLRAERERIERQMGHSRRVSERIDIWVGQQRWRVKVFNRWAVAARPMVLLSRRVIHRHRRKLIWSFIVAVCLIIPGR